MTPRLESCVTLGAAGLASLALATPVRAIELNNGVDGVGAVTVDVDDAGEVFSYDLSGTREDDNSFVTEDVIFDYYAVVRLGNDGFSLNSTTTSAAARAGDAVVSSGSFTGTSGNTIDWTASTTLGAGSTVLSTAYDFTAQSGTLGQLSLFQYLDEDIFDVDDDIFFERGSLAGENLQLFTIDGPSGIGVSQGGAYSDAGGLNNASYLGYAATEYDELQDELADGTKGVSLAGLIDGTSLPATTSSLVTGTVYGPNDVVSALGWGVDADATSATLVTTLGGVPDLTFIPDPDPIDPVDPIDPIDPVDPNPVPSPSAALAGLALLGGLATRRRR